MKYPSIRIEGAILSADILDKIEQGELLGQKPKDFGFEGSNVRVKDEVVKAWADAQDMWRIYTRKMNDVTEHKAGTTETRNFWIVPLLGLLGFEVELYRRAQEIHGKTYAISHYSNNIDHFPIHIMGFRDSLDKKRIDSGPRMSPHALVQEYINLNEHLYAFVSNGLTIRLLRDSSRLIKLSFVEFDLDRMFEEEHFTDFALMFRLIHCSRMPIKQTEGPESLIEGYHQDSLDSGSRIRDGLSNAVEQSIKLFANGFLSHPENDKLRQAIIDVDLSEIEFYQYQLRFIYRLLFLMVIEERDLIFTKDTPRKKKDVYYNYYSVSRIRKLSEKRYLADKIFNDVWMSLKNTFKLFEKAFYGAKLDIKPLAGDLFGSNALGELAQCELNNKVMLECLTNLSVFTHPETQQKMRVNYASLNVEEFGSVYEGLLEYDPVLDVNGDKVEFRLVKGDERSSSGSHYTPDELVQPLIKHSLEYIIEDKLKMSEPEKALLSITVCDVACGSGHILLSAARRIATELAKIRTGEDQPSPSAFREAVRDVIRHCIYGVDKNPLAVELAKVALWLEAHNPGEPLNFLDHHIKCGDAIVGLAHKEELQNGIPDEAFKKLPSDDKEICKELRDRNKLERKRKQEFLDFSGAINKGVTNITELFHELDNLPEHTPEEIEAKRKKYKEITSGQNYWNLKLLADIMTAQFFIPKTDANQRKIITDAQYRNYLRGGNMQNQAVAEAMAEGIGNRFFHWFLEFPEVFSPPLEGGNEGGLGGFDCILGNPPYLGGRKISAEFGDTYLNYLIFNYAPAGKQSDLVTYFVKRDSKLCLSTGFISLISTDKISQGDSRELGLIPLLLNEWKICFAVKSMNWPGVAAVKVALFSLTRRVSKTVLLKTKWVSSINSHFEEGSVSKEPNFLQTNKNICFKGVVLKGIGFVLSIKEANELLQKNSNYYNVILQFINGSDLNDNPKQEPSRYIIHFNNLSLQECQKKYPELLKIIEERVKPDRDKLRTDPGAQKRWWLLARTADALYNNIKYNIVFSRSLASKHNTIAILNANLVFDQALVVFARSSLDFYSFIQSSIHYEWANNYSSDLGSTYRYNIARSFETFPFPQNLTPEMEAKLERIGEEYHEFRRQLMLKIQLGLTKTYNQFHNPQLTSEIVNSEIVSRKELQKKFGKETVNLWSHLNKTDGVCSMAEAVEDIKHLRLLHKEMDEAVLRAYQWEDLNLAHDFYEVDYLPENDRVRYTISPEARKEVLKRLLLLNHEIYEEEVKKGLHDKKKPKKKVKAKVKERKSQKNLFGRSSQQPEQSETTDSEHYIGQDVMHPTFGHGIIKAVEGIGDDEKLTIAFGGGVVKKLMAKLANLGVL